MLYAQGLPFIATFCIQILSVGKSVVIGIQEFVSYTIIASTVLPLCIILYSAFYCCLFKCITGFYL